MFASDHISADDEGHGGLLAAMDEAHRRIGAAHRELLSLIDKADELSIWRNDGARDLGHWLSIRYGISSWKAHRWIAASHALERLPHTAEALSRGALGIDKVVELTRFATAEDEARLVRWAQGVSCATVRHRGDLMVQASREQVVETERARTLEWWYCDEGRRFALSAELPAAQGAVVARALARVSQIVPVMPDEEDASYASARRADALVALCSARLAVDPDPDRATVVIHAQLEGFASGSRGAELEDGPAVAQQVVERLVCSARVQVLVEDAAGDVVALDRMRREPPAWMVRQVRYRDRGCRFPGCGTRAFTEAHHIRWWRHGGRTHLTNLVLICSFHHRLVHEYGWGLAREPDGQVRWLRPDGTRYRAEPSPRMHAEADAEAEPLIAATG